MNIKKPSNVFSLEVFKTSLSQRELIKYIFDINVPINLLKQINLKQINYLFN